ncbi:MAG: succinate dehydrogenase, cytochrome b556 subunit [Acidobacteria bacterium]|nr:succinate dehydrogenase, cytochrome b556 subunit [Acidobacteriota bacterium]
MIRLVGNSAQLLQRITGIGLLVYLFLHVRTIHKLSEGPRAFDEAVAVFRSPLFKLGEIALLAAVILHAFNGIRITIAGLGLAQGRQKQVFVWGVAGAGALLFVAGAAPMFWFGIVRAD